MGGAVTKASATNLRDLHLVRDYESLRELLSKEFEALRVDAIAVLIDEDENHASCEWSAEFDAPFRISSVVQEEIRERAGWTVPLRYSEDTVGHAFFETAPTLALRNEVETFLTHWTTAFVNRRLADHNIQALEEYGASLRVLEEGVVLLQEHDRDLLGARYLGLFSKSLGTDIAVIYLLDKPGDLNTELAIEHITGLPEELLEDLVDEDGTPWPRSILEGPPVFLERDEEMNFGSMNAGRLTQAMHNIVGIPLSCNGEALGVAVGINIKAGARVRARIDGARRLTELCAALFYRVKLENQNLLSKLLENQLNIASKLQSQLVPTEAPQTDRYSFAWSSRPALYVGGDYVDFIEDDSTVHVAIADVAGHGVNSALLMTSFRASCRARVHGNTPASLLAELNNNVAREVGSHRHVPNRCCRERLEERPSSPHRECGAQLDPALACGRGHLRRARVLGTAPGLHPRRRLRER